MAAKKTSRTSAKAWSGRFTTPPSELMERFTESLSVDRELAPYDIDGSLAHVAMLAHVQLITQKDERALTRGLKQIAREIDSGAFPWRSEHEDIHMAIEARLTELTGAAGKKIHTGRSRNDQVALDMHLYLRDKADVLGARLDAVVAVLVHLAEAHLDTIMPGYTHLRRGQPVVFAHWLHAYVEMFDRDAGRLADCVKRADEMPLGSGALAGSSLPLQRKHVQKALHFSRLTRNSMDAVSDRDFLLEFLSFGAIAAMHLSRLAEDLILFSSEEFGFLELPEDFCTGSSMMPNKRNPDVLELIRGKTGRVYGNLMRLLTIMKGLPLTYNRDLQEDKEAVFDTVRTLDASLEILAAMAPGIIVDADAMREASEGGYTVATELAEYLVTKGVPFRDAHGIAGQAVRLAEEHGCALHELPVDVLTGLAPQINRDVYQYLRVDDAVRAKNLPGGTASRRVQNAVMRRLNRGK